MQTKHIIIKALQIAFFFLLIFFSEKTWSQDTSFQNSLLRLNSIIDTAKSIDTKANALFDLGELYQDNNSYDTAITYKLEAGNLQKQLFLKGDTLAGQKFAKNYIGIATLYLNMGLPDQAEKYLKEARPMVISNPKLTARYYRIFSDAMRMYAQGGVEKIDKSVLYYDSLTNFVKKANPEDGWYYRITLDLGLTSYYLSVKDGDNALKYINRAQELAPQWADTLLQSQINYMTGSVYSFRNEFEKAIPFLKKAEKESDSWMPELKVNLYKDLANAYTGAGMYKLATDYYNMYVPLRDTLYTHATEQSFANAEAKYQNKEKQQQIDLQHTQLYFAKKQRYWLIGGLALAGLVALLLLIIYRNKKRTADTLGKLNHDLNEANKTKAKLFSIISHDLRSPINQVYQFLKLQQLKPNLLSTQQKDELSNKIQTATGSLLETMEDLLLWSKTQMSEFNVQKSETDLLPVIKGNLQLMQLNIESKNLKVENHVPETAQLFTDPYFLQTIIRNILQNAVKASPQAGKITIDFDEAQNALQIGNEGGTFTHQDYEAAIKDDYSNKSLTGLGLKLVAELAQKINAQVHFKRSSNNQTICTVTF